MINVAGQLRHDFFRWLFAVGTLSLIVFLVVATCLIYVSILGGCSADNPEAYPIGSVLPNDAEIQFTLQTAWCDVVYIRDAITSHLVLVAYGRQKWTTQLTEGREYTVSGAFGGNCKMHEKTFTAVSDSTYIL